MLKLNMIACCLSGHYVYIVNCFMYNIVLILHSLTRWLVLASLVYSIYIAYAGWLGRKSFGKSDGIARQLTVTFAHIQFSLGLILYFISPITDYFMHHFSEAVH